MSPGAAGLGGWIPIFLNEAAPAIISLLGLLSLLLLNKSSSFLVLGLGLALLILASGLAALAWSLTHREKLMPLTQAITRFLARIHVSEVATGRLLEAWDNLLQAGCRGPATGAALNTGFDMLTLAFLFLSAGHGVSRMVLLAAYGVPQLFGKLTVILGGVGVVETTMVGLYDALGVPIAAAVVVVLVYRLLSLWVPTLVGIALVPYLERAKPPHIQNGGSRSRC